MKGFPGGSEVKNHLQCRRHAFDPCFGKIPWKRNGNLVQCSHLGNTRDQGSWKSMGLQRVCYNLATKPPSPPKLTDESAHNSSSSNKSDSRNFLKIEINIFNIFLKSMHGLSHSVDKTV